MRLISVPGINADYGAAVQCVRDAAHVMEQGARDLRPWAEDPLRRMIVVALSAQFPGRVGGETLNAAGRPDVVVRAVGGPVQGANTLVGEVKLWGGQRALQGALEQLLGYVTRRDRGLLLVVFVRNRGVSSVLRRGKEALAAHPVVDSVERDLDDDQVVRLVVRHPADPSLHALVTVVFVSLPDDRADAAGGGIDDESGLSQLVGVDDAEMATAPVAHEGLRTGRMVAEGARGARALKLLDEALRWHVGVRIEGGMRIEFDEFPAELRGSAEELAQARDPVIELQPTPGWSWPVVLHVRTTHGELDVAIALYEVPPEAGFDFTLRGSFHNLSFSMSLHRKLDGTFDERFDWRLHPSDLPVRDRLAALDFLYACSGEGELHWESKTEDLPSTTIGLAGDELDRSLLFDRAFFTDLVALENWTDTALGLPTSATADQVREIAAAAAAVRAGAWTVFWNGSTWRLDRKAAPEVGDTGDTDDMPMAVEAEIFGQLVRLGFARGQTRYVVTAIEDLPGDPDHVAVTFKPQDDEAKIVPVRDLRHPGMSDGNSEPGGNNDPGS